MLDPPQYNQMLVATAFSANKYKHFKAYLKKKLSCHLMHEQQVFFSLFLGNFFLFAL